MQPGATTRRGPALEAWRAAKARGELWASDYSDPRTLAACYEASSAELETPGQAARVIAAGQDILA
jgi:hypothetical protein